MGVDLKLLPVECDNTHISYSNTILSLDRDYDLQKSINNLNSIEFGKPLICDLSKNEDGSIIECCYGDSLKWLYAIDMFNAFAIIADLSDKNSAAMAYLFALPEKTKVILCWC